MHELFAGDGFLLVKMACKLVELGAVLGEDVHSLFVLLFHKLHHALIDQRVVELVKKQHEKAVNILTENRAKLDELARHLYEKETITGEEFMHILNEA